MIRRKTKEIIREYVPNILVLKKIITKIKVKKLQKTIIPKCDCEFGENSFEAMETIVGMCKKKWPKEYKKTLDSVNKIYENAFIYRKLDDNEKKKLQTDMIFCRFGYGIIPSEYVTYLFHKKTSSERKNFISEIEHIQFSYMMNDMFSWQIFNDKMKTYDRFKTYYQREVISIETEKDYSQFVDFITRHPIFVKKNAYESCGKSIEKVNIKNCEITIRNLFQTYIKTGKTILEECVVQGKETEIFNSSSVNTVRCLTFNTKNGIVVPYCFMKIGRQGSFVDNGGSGGIFVGILANTGVLNTSGVDERGNVYEKHPDSQVKFEGYQLPQWSKMIECCKKMASTIPEIKYIGWDMAYTNKQRWIVIEGNGMSQFIGPQSTMQCGIKDEVTNIMNQMELMI